MSNSTTYEWVWDRHINNPKGSFTYNGKEYTFDFDVPKPSYSRFLKNKDIIE